MRQAQRSVVRRIVAAALVGAVAAGAGPAAPQDDPLGLKEFGAYADPEQARQMISTCDVETLDLKARLSSYDEAVKTYGRLRDDFARQSEALDVESREANRAVDEAYAHWKTLKGAAADQFAANVLEPRRQRVDALRLRPRPDEAPLNSALEAFSQRARAAGALLRELGVPDARAVAATSAELVRDQEERCRRMRAWAQLGERGRTPVPSPSSPPSPAVAGSWPQAALAAWEGQWSCRRQSTRDGQTITVTVAAKVRSFVRDGLVQAYLSTDTSPTLPSNRSNSIFSPLRVTEADPTRGAFANHAALGETRVSIDAYDVAVLPSPGRLSFLRRSTRWPEHIEALDCTREPR